MTPSDESMREGAGREDSRNMMWLFGQFLMVPVAAFLYGVEMLLKTMQGMQQVTSQGVEVMVGPNAFSSRMPEASGAAVIAVSDSKISSTKPESSRTNKEDKKLIDPNQRFCIPDLKDGPCLVLWRYKVLFIKRDLEYAFPEAEDLVPNDVTDLTAWKIAEFIQQLGQCKVEVPRKWIEKRYPNPKKFWRADCDSENGNGEVEDIEEACNRNIRIYLVGLPEDDKKFLRLYAQPLASYTRQDPKYEERQIEVLEQIRDRIRQP